MNADLAMSCGARGIISIPYPKRLPLSYREKREKYKKDLPVIKLRRACNYGA